MAGDAEEFTKEFMNQLSGGQHQQQHQHQHQQQHQQHQHQQGPPGVKLGPGPGPGDWSRKLAADKAGMADNAEDFTKEFMKQLTGGQ